MYGKELIKHNRYQRAQKNSQEDQLTNEMDTVKISDTLYHTII